MRRTVVLEIPGLSASCLNDRSPHLTALARRGGTRQLEGVLPAVGPVMQATFTTGLAPSEHGCVGTGWYSRELAEVCFGRNVSRLVSGERIWEAARRVEPSFTVASIFWSHAAYGSADWVVSPRVVERADGRRLHAIHAHPRALEVELERALGAFPRGAHGMPAGTLAATGWVGRAARNLYQSRRPALTLVSLPHLDLALQRLGPDSPELGRELEEVDAIVGELIDHVERDGARVLVLSTHAVAPVSGPVHINRALREAQLLEVRDEAGFEVLDPGASAAFAVADHQTAHVYVARPELLAGVQRMLAALPGVDLVLDRDAMATAGLEHERSGELFAIAAPDRWFTYYWWTRDEAAPDFARTVDPLRKPGYDPAELYLDPSLVFPQLRRAWKGALCALGLRSIVDVVPLDAGVVRGSYGRLSSDAALRPIAISGEPELAGRPAIPAKDVKALVLAHLFGPGIRLGAVDHHEAEVLLAEKREDRRQRIRM